MEYFRAKKEDLEQVYQLVQDTIQTIYPQYYPHKMKNIQISKSSCKMTALPPAKLAAMKAVYWAAIYLPAK